jgi:hypothetical protein
MTKKAHDWAHSSRPSKSGEPAQLAALSLTKKHQTLSFHQL